MQSPAQHKVTGFSLQLLDNLVDPRRGEMAEKPALDHHGRGLVAVTDASGGQHGEHAVGGDLPGAHPQFPAHIVEQRPLVEHPADHAVADMEDEAAHGLPVDEVVESGQFLQFQGRQAHHGRGLDQALAGEIAVMPLDLVHDVDGLFPGIFGLVDLAFQLLM